VRGKLGRFHSQEISAVRQTAHLVSSARGNRWIGIHIREPGRNHGGKCRGGSDLPCVTANGPSGRGYRVPIKCDRLNQRCSIGGSGQKGGGGVRRGGGGDGGRGAPAARRGGMHRK